MPDLYKYIKCKKCGSEEKHLASAGPTPAWVCTVCGNKIPRKKAVDARATDAGCVRCRAAVATVGNLCGYCHKIKERSKQAAAAAKAAEEREARERESRAYDTRGVDYAALQKAIDAKHARIIPV